MRPMHLGLAALAAFAAAALVATPRLLAAQTAAAPVTIEACYVPASGTIYRIKAPNTPAGCLSPAHVPFTWNQQGPAGPPGPKGDTGDPAALPTNAWGGFKLDNPNGFASVGTVDQGNVLGVSGAGARLLWYPRKAAFRAGYVPGSQWDDARIGPYSIAMGYAAAAERQYSTALGYHATAQAPFATALGRESQATNEAATAIGRAAFARGYRSISLGVFSETNGSHAVAVGFESKAGGEEATALGRLAAAAGDYATAIGHQAAAAGDYATAMGYRSAARGGRSMALGHKTVASGAFATAIGDQTTASGDQSTALGAHASTDGKAGALVYGDASTTALVKPTAANQFVARVTGGVYFGTTATMDRGCYIPAGGSGWQCTSDRRQKTAFRPVSGERVLRGLRAMPITTWRSRADTTGARHLGPAAQDFRAAFGLGVDGLTINSVDAQGVALAAAQALEARTRVLQEENAALRARLAASERAVAEVRAEVREALRRLGAPPARVASRAP